VHSRGLYRSSHHATSFVHACICDCHGSCMCFPGLAEYHRAGQLCHHRRGVFVSYLSAVISRSDAPPDKPLSASTRASRVRIVQMCTFLQSIFFNHFLMCNKRQSASLRSELLSWLMSLLSRGPSKCPGLHPHTCLPASPALMTQRNPVKISWTTSFVQ
jgi:hypothetical protein